ncbi:nucleotidyltransferase [Chelativorans sp. M5D2P16]|uniref:nucleotidyltransferase n=1 Tax=Chelativorans sp. M5D2P16 TaxID=3095678 RepID=UPI002ACA438D|nr:nucleotidyltransferase [Chelativorans sp. M5D2P16]MDZ5699062.1 nucleotidyltransferase [Chelativorans sp. M5D2P16]
MTSDPPSSSPHTGALHARAAPVIDSAEAEAFYADAIRALDEAGIPFLVAGTFAVSAYTGISRATKDLDIFCKAGDWPRILTHFKELGDRVHIEDERWLGKVERGAAFFDVIFASSNGTSPVTDTWFENARESDVLGHSVRLVGPTELVWSKCFIQNRERYDGADVAHLILRSHGEIDWARLLQHMEMHWEVLLIHLLNFRWIYPSERDHVPEWLLDELLDRLRHQRKLPPPSARICRGRMFSSADYEIDVREWNFADIDGKDGKQE